MNGTASARARRPSRTQADWSSWRYTDGNLTPVLDGSGQELMLDRPTSMEIVGDTAYVVSLVGDVYRVDNL